MINTDLKNLSYYDYIIKYNSTKTKDILNIIDHEYLSSSQIIELLMSNDFATDKNKALLNTAISHRELKTIRECGKKTFKKEYEDKANTIGIDISSELFESFWDLGNEIQLFEMFGDTDTANNLVKQQFMVGLLNSDAPNIVYWWAYEDSDNKCKYLHNSCEPLIQEYAEIFQENISHPNCRCILKEEPPTPGVYLERNTSGLPDFYKNLFGFDFFKEAKNTINTIKEVFSSLSFSEKIHGILDILGFIPVYGAIADAINAIFYLAEGDYGNAALSGIAAIPIIGWLGGAGKVINTGAKVVDKANDAIRVVDKVTDAMKIADKMRDTAKFIDKTGDIAKYIDKIADTSKIVNRAGDYARIADKFSDAIKATDKTADTAKIAKEFLDQLKNVDKITDTVRIVDVSKSVKGAVTADDIAKGLNKATDTKKIIENAAGAGNFTDKINDALKTKSKIEDIIKTADKASDTVKASGRIGYAVKTADKVADLGKTVDKLSDTGKIIDKISDSGKVAGKTIDVGDGIKGIDNLQNASKSDILINRNTWRQSEIKAEGIYEGFEKQKSFLDGELTSYAKKGSSRPDLYQEGISIEVKNYNVVQQQNLKSLIDNLERGFNKRLLNLPVGTKQRVVIDTIGQNITDEMSDNIFKKITERIKDFDQIILWRD